MRRSHANDASARWRGLGCQLGWLVLLLSPLAICGGTSRKEATLRPFVRVLSFVTLLRPSRGGISPGDLFRKSFPRLTSVTPDVLQVSIFTTLRRSGWHGWAKGEGSGEDESGTKRRLRSENFFFYVCSFFLPALQLLELSPFFFHAKTRLISPARMTLRGQVVGDSEILPAGSVLVHGMYSACSGTGIIGEWRGRIACKSGQ